MDLTCFDKHFRVDRTITGHTSTIYDCVVVKYKEDEKKRIISAGFDYTLRVFQLSDGRMEKVINHSTAFYQIRKLMNKEEVVTSDWEGKLIFWGYPSFRKKRKVEVSKPFSLLRRLISINDNTYIIGCELGASEGNLTRACIFNDDPQGMSSSVQVDILFVHSEGIKALCQLKSDCDIVCFAGGKLLSKGGKDFNLRMLNWKTGNLIMVFAPAHTTGVNAIHSCFIKRNERIISGSYHLIAVHDLHGCLIEVYENGYQINCFVNLFKNYLLCGGGSGTSGEMSVILIGEKKEIPMASHHTAHIREFWKVEEEEQEEQEEEINLFLSVASDKKIVMFQGTEEYQILKLKDHNFDPKREEKERINYLQEEKEEYLSFSILISREKSTSLSSFKGLLVT